MNQSENNQLNEPPVPQKQIWMLGFFDVLGFSARVKNENIDKIYEDYENLIKRVLSNHEIDTTGMIVPTFMGGSLFYSCSQEKKEEIAVVLPLDAALSQAGENRVELEKALHRYQSNPSDSCPTRK